MKFSCLSIFPKLIEGFARWGLIGKAIDKGLITLDTYDLRDYTRDKHKKVDDRPFGGGPGMVLMPDPLFRGVKAIKKKQEGKVLLFSAYGKVLTQNRIKQMASGNSHYILVCGRYEGVDQRFIDCMVDEEISIGRYVVMGGELPALVFIEGVSRLLPGVIGDYDSVRSDSFYQKGQMGYPQYTQPRDYQGLRVPDVLLEGHHEKIQKWRINQSQNKKNR